MQQVRQLQAPGANNLPSPGCSGMQMAPQTLMLVAAPEGSTMIPSKVGPSPLGGRSGSQSEHDYEEEYVQQDDEDMEEGGEVVEEKYKDVEEKNARDEDEEGIGRE